MKLDTVVCGDCLDILPTIPDASVDAVITDPPFGTNTKEWDIEPTEEMWHEMRRIGKNLFAIFGYPENLIRWSRFFEDLTLIGYIIWVKYNEPLVTTGLTRFHQDIAIWGMNRKQIKAGEVRDAYNLDKSVEKFFPGRGKKGRQRARTEFNRSNGRRCTDVWTIAAPGHGFNSHLRKHPNEKPVLILERLIRLLTEPGDLVVDPFIGSAPVAEAAIKLERHFFGCDIMPEYVDIANERIAKARDEMLQMELAL